jgi:pimeloyl-ACP methyl ester carboxylesterase
MEKADSAKPLALLIPGLDGTGRLYARQIAALSERYQVLALEFRAREYFELADLVDEVVAVVRNEESGSVLIVAESFGGLVAMQFALDYSEKIRQMVLINTFPYYRRRIRISLACNLVRIMNRPFPRRLKDFVVDRALASECISATGRQQYREAIRHVYYPAYCRRLQLVRDIDLRDRLHEIEVPTRLFASVRDKLVPSIEEARYMHSVLPNSVVYEFPNAGHALLLTPGFSLTTYLS